MGVGSVALGLIYRAFLRGSSVLRFEGSGHQFASWTPVPPHRLPVLMSVLCFSKNWGGSPERAVGDYSQDCVSVTPPPGQRGGCLLRGHPCLWSPIFHPDQGGEALGDTLANFLERIFKGTAAA